jgi:hypothetical protein
MKAALRRLLRRLRCGPMVDDLGFPGRRHLESLDTELPERDEQWLAELAAGLWPDDEYVDIITGDGS